MRVLIAYDGSAGAAMAVRLAEKIDWSAGSMVRVVSVMETAPIPVRPATPGIDSTALETDLRAHIEAEQAAVIGRLSVPGRTLDAVLLRDRPASALVDQTREFSADLLIVASRGHGPIASLPLGSVSTEVVEQERCAVIVARRSTLKRIVFGTDGSTTAIAAEAILARWPFFASVPILVVSVADVVRPWASGIAPTMYAQVLNAYAKDVAEANAEHLGVAMESAKRLAEAGRWADAEIRTGDAAAEIIAVAQDSGADLIVVGSRGLTGLDRIVLGSVARNLLVGSEASVLVIHQPAEA